MRALIAPPMFSRWTAVPDELHPINLAAGTAAIEAQLVEIEEGIEALRGGQGPATPESAELLATWNRHYGGAAPAEHARAIGLANEVGVETVTTEPTTAALLAEWDRRCPR